MKIKTQQQSSSENDDNAADPSIAEINSADAGVVPADKSTQVEALEQLRAENEQLRTTVRLEQAHRQITGELARAGARSPELLFEAIKAELKFGTRGEVEGLGALVSDIRSRFPEQFGTQQPASIDGGAGRGSGNTLTREALAKMTPAEIARLDWADVRDVLAGS